MKGEEIDWLGRTKPKAADKRNEEKSVADMPK